jgi:hypothetical protein
VKVLQIAGLELTFMHTVQVYSTGSTSQIVPSHTGMAKSCRRTNCSEVSGAVGRSFSSKLHPHGFELLDVGKASRLGKLPMLDAKAGI